MVAHGLLAHTAEGTWRATPPGPPPGCPAGAGDAAVGGLLSGLVESLPWPDRLARAVALSAATAQPPATADFDRRTYEGLLSGITVTDEAGAA